MDVVDLKQTPNFARNLFATMGKFGTLWLLLMDNFYLILYNGVCFIHLPPPHYTCPEISAYLKKLLKSRKNQATWIFKVVLSL